MSEQTRKAIRDVCGVIVIGLGLLGLAHGVAYSGWVLAVGLFALL